MKGQDWCLPSLERNRQKPSAVETIMRRKEGIFLKFHIKLESSESVKEQKCVCRVSLYRSHPNYRVDWIDNSKARDRSKISSVFRNCRLILSLNSNLWSFNILYFYRNHGHSLCLPICFSDYIFHILEIIIGLPILFCFNIRKPNIDRKDHRPEKELQSRSPSQHSARQGAAQEQRI